MVWEEESAGNEACFKYNHWRGPSNKAASKHTCGRGYSGAAGDLRAETPNMRPLGMYPELIQTVEVFDSAEDWLRDNV